MSLLLNRLFYAHLFVIISVKSDSLAGMIELIFFVAIAARGETPSTVSTLVAFQTEFLRREHMAAKESTCSRLSLPASRIAYKQAFLLGLGNVSIIFWLELSFAVVVRESSI